MGRIMKYGMERLDRRNLKVSLDCPNCGSARIVMNGGNGDGYLEGRTCPKCGIEIILDGVNITVVDETFESHEAEPSERHSAGTIV